MNNKDEALKLALEALKEDRAWLETDAPTEVWEKNNEAITAIKAALLSRSDGEAKDEKANDELRRLHDLLGKANALARIRANKIDELEQRLTKTEAQLGEAVWNYGELKREQLANQQKTSGSPINTSTALEAKDEPVAWRDAAIRLGEELSSVGPNGYYDMDAKEWLNWAMEQNPRGEHSLPQRTWVGLTDEEIAEALGDEIDSVYMTDFRRVEAKLKEKNG